MKSSSFLNFLLAAHEMRILRKGDYHVATSALVYQEYQIFDSANLLLKDNSLTFVVCWHPVLQESLCHRCSGREGPQQLR
jgi:hypothetical protein